MNYALRWPVVALLSYLGLCVISGIFVAESALHPARRSLPPEAKVTAQRMARGLESNVQDVSITTPGGVTLRAWLILPQGSNGTSVLLLHGLSDNRIGMIGYAELLLQHGYTVLMPDARAHGVSGGDLAAYGLLERDDIHRWVDWLAAGEHPGCIFGFGESMGAAQLLQSLSSEPRFCAIAAESSFSNFREVAYDRVGQFFRTGPWLGRTALRPVIEIAFSYTRWKYRLDMEKISPEDDIAATRVPVLLIHGQSDRNIPLRHSRRIHARNPNTLLWEVPGADHCGAISAARQELEERLARWFTAPALFSSASSAVFIPVPSRNPSFHCEVN